MVRVSFILIIIAGLFGNSFCQDSTFIKNRWQVAGGNNMLIPVRNYDEEFFKWTDSPYGEFYVKPSFTISNFFIDFNYRHTYYKKGKNSFFGTKMGIGYEHLTRKQVKEGYCWSCGDFGNIFEGTITSIKKDEFFFLEFALNHNFLVRQKVWITNQVGFEFDFLFYQSTHSVYNGNYNKKTMFDIWGIWGPSLNMNYQLQATVQLNKHWLLDSGFEIPLLIVNDIIMESWREQYYWETSPYANYRTSPWLSSSASSSKDKFAFIFFRSAIIYKI